VADGSETDPGSRSAGTRQPKGQGAQHVYDRLREEILDLRIRPGTMLDENEIGARLGVSRSPVREAIIRLAAEGLVDTLRNRGAMAAQFDMEDLPDFFEALKLVYRLTARGAARNATPDDIAALERIQREHEDILARRSLIEMIGQNQAFHQRLAEAAGNRWVTQWQKGLLDHGQRVLRLHARLLGDAVPGEQLEHHRRIIAAVRAGDADAADAAGAEDASLMRDRLISYMMTERFSSVPLP
jgi:DNA-binding GntR family transcriptional regulator